MLVYIEGVLQESWTDEAESWQASSDDTAVTGERNAAQIARRPLAFLDATNLRRLA
jgi:hypothetical protein